MKPLQLALKYLEVFFGGVDMEALRPLFAEDLKFKGPLYASDTAEEYIRALKSDPPRGLDYRILGFNEKETSARLVYFFSKPGVRTPMDQAFEVDDGKITKFKEKKEISGLWMNAGIYHLQKDMLKDLPDKGDIEKTVFPDYAKKGKLSIVKFHHAKWYSIDSFKDMEECSLEIEDIIK